MSSYNKNEHICGSKENIFWENSIEYKLKQIKKRDYFKILYYIYYFDRSISTE